MSAVPDSVLIVGGGATGSAVADNLARLGYEGQVVVLGDEADRPYDRPALSKHVLAGDYDLGRLPLHTEEVWTEHGAEWLLGRRAAALDPVARVVALEDGTELEFGHVVIATGVRPRFLPGARFEGVHVLRTLDDSMSLKRDLGPGSRLVVVGAGFLGLEAAATARSLDVEVTVVEPLERPLASRLGDLLAERLLELHRGRGVEVRTGVGVERLSGDHHRVESVHLTDGTELPAESVLVAIGCRPCVDWLEDSGLEIVDGVTCDEFCSAAPGIWAAGDIARWYHPKLGRHLRVEHRMNANEQGRAVAANIIGPPAAFTPIPFFWTDHYDVKIQMWGVIPPEPGVEVLVDEGPDGATAVGFYEDDRLVGAAGWNAPGRMAALRRQIAASW